MPQAPTTKKPKDRPQPIRLMGCSCGGIGDTGSHAVGCIWGRTR